MGLQGRLLPVACHYVITSDQHFHTPGTASLPSASQFLLLWKTPCVCGIMCGLFCGTWPFRRSNTTQVHPPCCWGQDHSSVHTGHTFCVHPSTMDTLISSTSGLQWMWEAISSTYSDLTSFEKVPRGVTAGSREGSLFSASHFYFKYFS